MKDYNHIEKLLVRFYNAETSEQEEQELRDTALRKLLILLFFCKFYAQLRHNLRQKYRSFLRSNAPDIFGETQFSFNYFYDPQDYSRYFNEFSKNLNIQLAKCGFGGLYPRNPYDCLFLLAASSAHPLEALPAMLINGPPSTKPKDPKKAKITQAELARLEGRVAYSFWEKPDAAHTVVRFATSWSTDEADVAALREVL